MTQQYPLATVEPQFWQAAITAAVSIAMIVMIGMWVFSQFKKVSKGEEIQKPF